MAREGRLSTFNSINSFLYQNISKKDNNKENIDINRNSNNSEGRGSLNEIKNEISLNDYLYNENKNEQDIENNNIIINRDNSEKITDISSDRSDLIEMENEVRSISEGGTNNNNLPIFTQKKNYFFYNLINFENKFGNPFGEKWLEICEKIKIDSPYRNFPSHNIKSFIAKADDDLRQESLSMQLIKMMNNIFKKSDLPLQLRTYEIIITSRNSGLIEFIPDSISIDGLKKKTNTDLNTFYRHFFKHHFKEAQNNFVESLAG